MVLTEKDARWIKRQHIGRPHKVQPETQVCALCTSVEGSGDGMDGCFVQWPCPTLRLLRFWEERA